MNYKNKMSITFQAVSENESFARSVIGCFALKLNPSISDLSDIKTAVSEAVTNCIVHGYPQKKGEIIMTAEIENDFIHIEISDNGVGIENVEIATQPLFTTRSDEERSGMGFTIMESFMDDLKVKSQINKGTTVFMTKQIKTHV